MVRYELAVLCRIFKELLKNVSPAQRETEKATVGTHANNKQEIRRERERESEGGDVRRRQKEYLTTSGIFTFMNVIMCECACVILIIR